MIAFIMFPLEIRGVLQEENVYILVLLNNMTLCKLCIMKPSFWQDTKTYSYEIQV